MPFRDWVLPTVVPPANAPPGIQWIRGQHELGAGGFSHWQLFIAFKSKKSLAAVKSLFPTAHAELSRSPAAADYVWKEATRVEGSQFEFGARPFRRNSAVDWESVWDSAKSGNLGAIPANVRVVSYRTLRAIAADHDRPVGMERVCHVFWGSTGTGKSRRAWDEAGMGAYCKDPRSKFWCGYQGDESVVIDEFRGGIDISHLLRWLDRYPCRVELKGSLVLFDLTLGSSVPLVAKTIWITSNLSPDAWYPDLDAESLAALRRRLNIVHFN